MAKAKARELSDNPRTAQPYMKPDMTGRVTHSEVWQRAMKRWKPGMRIVVEFDR